MSVALTPAEGKLLRVLQDRARHKAPTWTCWAARSRRIIVGPRYPHLTARQVWLRSSDNAVRALRGLGLIHPLGEREFLGSYLGWRHLDDTSGERIRLTDLGTVTCPCGAQDGGERVEYCTTATSRDHSYRPRGLVVS